MDKSQVTDAIKTVTSSFDGGDILWVVGGSGSLLVHGLDCVPTDLNIIIDTDSYMNAVKSLSKYMTVETTEHHDGVNTFFQIAGVEVEAIDYGHLDRGNIIHVNMDGVSVPVYTLETEYAFYKNRDDKKEKLKLIEKALGL